MRLATHDDAQNGYVKGRPRKWIKGHHLRKPLEDLYVITESGCWEWQGSMLRCGYGTLTRDGCRSLAHRFVYERHVGPIPEELQLDHLCRVRRCVNPAHLEPVTNAENGRRGINTKLTVADVHAIRASDEDARLLAARYGISRSYVYNLRGGWAWKDVA